MRKLSLKKLNVGKNIKTSAKKTELIQDLWGVLAVATYLLPASLLKLNGYTGLLVSWLTTWLTGAIFNVPALRRASFAMAGVHLAYAKLTSNFNDMGITLWRMGDDVPAIPETTTSGMYGMGRLSNNVNPYPTQQGSTVFELPSNTTVQARPAFELNSGSTATTNTDSLMGLDELVSLPSRSTARNVTKLSTATQVANVNLLPGAGRRR